MIRDILILGKPREIFSLEILNPEDILDLYKKYDKDFIYNIQGQFCIQIIFEDNRSLIFTDKLGFYPTFLDIRKGSICNNIEISNINENFIEESESYNDISYQSIINKDIFSNIINNLEIIRKLKSCMFFDTIDTNYKLLKPNSIYTIDRNSYDRADYEDQEYNSKSSPSSRLLYIINKRYKENSLIELSFGYDTRLILACLLKLGLKFKYISYGEEKLLVKKYLSQIIKDATIEEISEELILKDTENIVKSHLYSTNGFGDPFYKAHNYYCTDNFYEKCGLLISGGGLNEFYNMYKDKMNFLLESIRFNTGVGHHIKYVLSKCNALYIYADLIFLSSIRNENKNKDEIIKELTSEIYPTLVNVPYFNDIIKPNEIFSHFRSEKFSFNTRKKYLNMLKEEQSL